MKKLMTMSAVSAVLLAASAAFESMTFRYYNEDSVDYTWKATCSGSEYSITFDHSKTSSETLQGSTPCVLHTPGGDLTFKGDAKIHIKNGKVTVE